MYKKKYAGHSHEGWEFHTNFNVDVSYHGKSRTFRGMDIYIDDQLDHSEFYMYTVLYTTKYVYIFSTTIYIVRSFCITSSKFWIVHGVITDLQRAWNDCN